MSKKAPSGVNYQKLYWEKNYGVIPKNWEFVTIGSLFKTRNEKSSNKELYELYSFTIDKGVTPKTDRYERSFLLRDKEENEFAIVYPGDFVLNPMNLRFGAIGFSRITKPVLVSAYYNVLIPERDCIDSLFMETFLRSHQALGLYNKIAIGSLLEKRRVHLSILDKTYIPLPPIDEQKRMARVFSIWDLAIDKTMKLIEVKEEYKQGLMQRLLTGETRLKGYKNIWREYALGDLFEERAETGYEHLPLLSITREEGVILREETDRRDSSNEDKSNYLHICPGDIGYNTMRMWQGISAISSIEGIVSPAYTICAPKNGVDGTFMAYLFKLPRIIHQFHRYSQGLTSDTWNLKFRNFEKIKVLIPDIEEQKVIASIFKAYDKEIDLLKRRLEALRKQKRSLMQKLLTGEWRVKATKEGKDGT